MGKIKGYYQLLFEAQDDAMKKVMINRDQHRKLMEIKDTDSILLSHIRSILPEIIGGNGYEIRIAKSILKALPQEIKAILYEDQSTNLDVS